MDKRENLIKFLESQLGTKEYPAGTNIIKYNDWYYDTDAEDVGVRFLGIAKEYQRLRKRGAARPFAWCGAFVAYALHFTDIFVEKKLHEVLGYVPSTQNYLVAKQKKTKNPQPGDIVIFDWNNDGFEEHIGFYVATHLKNGVIYYETIEGNTSPDEKSSQSNGGMVCKKMRKNSLVEGIYNVID